MITEIIRELHLTLRNFVNESCLKVNPVLELKHCTVLKENFEI